MKEILRKIISGCNGNTSASLDMLFENFDSIFKISEATLDMISDAMCGDMKTSVYIKLIFSVASRRICDRYKPGKVYTDDEISQYLTALFFTTPMESACVISLDGAGRLISVDFIGEGTVNLLGIVPRKVLEIAVRRKATSIILAHNHPGGYPMPSEDDAVATETIKGVLTSSGVTLKEHYIISANEISKMNL